MPVGKKLVVVASLLATGVGTALFFRKDASQVERRPEATEDLAFRERVERRVATDAAWAKSLGARSASRPAQPLRVPATAAILEPKGLATETQPTFQKSFNPVGALLEPPESTPLDEPTADETADSAISPVGPDGPAPRTHTIADGDTLSRLAERYLGRGERYLEIFELNRDVLSSPDLLPIGVELKIPCRDGTLPTAGSLDIQPDSTDEQSAPPLETVPRRTEDTERD